MSRTKVLVAMSGGVDSSVAALLLLQQGYDVIGATFRAFNGLNGDHSTADIQDAKRVCDALEIKHHLFDFTQLFADVVIANFVQEYDSGHTPNPCVLCNKTVKFGALFEKAHELGAQKIATGHYASVIYDDVYARYRLKSGQLQEKDQSYALYTLSQSVLASCIFPLGELSKAEVRQIALANNLIVGNKPDSQDICFVPDGNYGQFLKQYTKRESEQGNFIDQNGQVIGKHKGIWHYTIGQRKGLGMAFGQPMFVSRINCKDNTVTLGSEDLLFQSELIAKNINLIDYEDTQQPFTCTAKIRYNCKPQPATVQMLENAQAKIAFQQPQRAITKGQSVVFYNGQYVVGGGIIC